MGAYRLNETKELAIYTWISTILPSFTVIWDKPDALRPRLPYITMNVAPGIRHIGRPELRYRGEDTFTHTLRKSLTLTINVYANNKYLEYMETLLDSLVLSTTQKTLRDAGFAIWGHSDPLDISQLLDTQHEFRATVDIFLAYAVTLDDLCGEIRIVTIGDAYELTTEGGNSLTSEDTTDDIIVFITSDDSLFHQTIEI